MGIFDELTSGVVVSPLIDKFLESKGFWKSKDKKTLVWKIITLDEQYEYIIEVKAKGVLITKQTSWCEVSHTTANVTPEAKSSVEAMTSLLNKIFGKAGISSYGETSGSFEIITRPYVISPEVDSFLLSRGFKYYGKQGELGRLLGLYIVQDAYFGTGIKLMLKNQTILGEFVEDMPYRVAAKTSRDIKKEDLRNIPKIVELLDSVIEQLK